MPSYVSPVLSEAEAERACSVLPPSFFSFEREGKAESGALSALDTLMVLPLLLL